MLSLVKQKVILHIKINILIEQLANTQAIIEEAIEIVNKHLKIYLTSLIIN